MHSGRAPRGWRAPPALAAMYSPADYQAFVVSNERRDFVGKPTGAFVARYKVKCRTPEVHGSWGAEFVPQKGVDRVVKGYQIAGAPHNLLHHFCSPVCSGIYEHSWIPAHRARARAPPVPVHSAPPSLAAVAGVNVGAGVGGAVVGAGGAGLDAFALLRAGAAVQAGLERAKRVRVELARTRAAAGAARRAVAGMSAVVFDKDAQVPKP